MRKRQNDHFHKQMPQECEGKWEMDQEGTAGDAGGAEQGAGQVSSSGISCYLPRIERMLMFYK